MQVTATGPYMTATAPPASDTVQLARLADAVTALRSQVGERVVGQREAVDGVLTAILGGGHALLVGVPGLAKTLLVSTVAEALNLSFNRVQFTPDLLPGDITAPNAGGGTATASGSSASCAQSSRSRAGQDTSNPPKTQAACCSMQDGP